jgi:uridine phosphorylase
LRHFANPLRAHNSRSIARTSKRSSVSRIPLLECDRARVAIIEPSRVIKPIDIAEHCVLCFFQEVIRDLVREGAQARQVHNGESEAGDYPVYELDYGGERLAVVHPESALPAQRPAWST